MLVITKHHRRPILQLGNWLRETGDTTDTGWATLHSPRLTSLQAHRHGVLPWQGGPGSQWGPGRCRTPGILRLQIQRRCRLAWVLWEPQLRGLRWEELEQARILENLLKLLDTNPSRRRVCSERNLPTLSSSRGLPSSRNGSHCGENQGPSPPLPGLGHED